MDCCCPDKLMPDDVAATDNAVLPSPSPIAATELLDADRGNLA